MPNILRAMPSGYGFGSFGAHSRCLDRGRALWNKAQRGKSVEAELLFESTGFDSDNGSKLLRHNMCDPFALKQEVEKRLKKNLRGAEVARRDS